MYGRWQRYRESLDGVTHQSFVIGLIGGTMLMATGNLACQYQLDTNTTSLTSTLEQMKMKYEVAGGVPYLLRDDMFLERLGVNNKHQGQQIHWIRLMLKQEWNGVVYRIANYLNQHCAKEYFE
ncbi:hypothetical protein BC941DRAFT_474381 [Chlamydoabsidia padenii]|nr:hypothetical protein BC941DRAFT_474381 [Chlamydoabsidia padenii]